MTDTVITLDWAGRDARRILGGVLDGGELSVDDGIHLTGASGRDLDEFARYAPQRSEALC